MKRPQWITLAIGLVLVIILFLFGRIVPSKKDEAVKQPDVTENNVSVDSILAQAKKGLTVDQTTRLNSLEHLVVRGDVKDEQLQVYHELAHFWADTAKAFEPYAWYEAQAARLENSEKNLTFAAHLFLQNLRGENDPSLRAWKALQAKDLFERSLKINPENDSSTIGLGACYIFGGIGETPMKGILQVLSVAQKDSTNIFAQEVLGQGSMLSGQYDKAISRFETVYRLSKTNQDTKLEASLMLAEAYERTNDSKKAIEWYKKSLEQIKDEDIKQEVRKRIDDLKNGATNKN